MISSLQTDHGIFGRQSKNLEYCNSLENSTVELRYFNRFDVFIFNTLELLSNLNISYILLD